MFMMNFYNREGAHRAEPPGGVDVDSSVRSGAGGAAGAPPPPPSMTGGSAKPKGLPKFQVKAGYQVKAKQEGAAAAQPPPPTVGSGAIAGQADADA